MMVQRVSPQQAACSLPTAQQMATALSALTKQVAPGVYVPFRLSTYKLYYAVCYIRQEGGRLELCFYRDEQMSWVVSFASWQAADGCCRRLNG